LISIQVTKYTRRHGKAVRVRLNGYASRMIMIMARASAQYQGRIDAELALGDVCIMIRDVESGGDGSVLIHDMQGGLPPRNWMPAGSEIEEIEGGLAVTHLKREERLEIYIETVYAQQYHESTLVSKLNKLGAEREFSDRLATFLGLIGPGYTLIGREWRTVAGPVDLLCYDANGTLVAIEVKRRAINPNAIWQMRRYLHALARMSEWAGAPMRGLVIAPSLENAAKAMLREHADIDFVRVHYDDLLAAERAVTEAAKKLNPPNGDASSDSPPPS
jgi:endonuclease